MDVMSLTLLQRELQTAKDRELSGLPPVGCVNREMCISAQKKSRNDGVLPEGVPLPFGCFPDHAE
jgi:hypothetical protein